MRLYNLRLEATGTRLSLHYMKITAHLSAGKVFALWWPLAASSLLMSFEMPFVNAGIARTADPETALAGFGLAVSLALLTEAPILMLNGTAAALAKDRASFKVLERFSLQLAVFVTCLSFLLSFTPLFDLMLRGWMGVPADVAAACLPALRIMLLWPAPIGWRRLHQGVLIRLRRTRLISLGTVVRLAISASLTLVTIFMLRLPGESAGALSVVTAVISESLLISFLARRLLSGAEFDPRDEPPISHVQLFHFYLPLLMVSAMSILAQPLISTALARGLFPTESLATWPTVWGLTGLVCSLCNPIQEVAIALADRHDALGVLRRFGLGVGLSASAILALFALTPLAGVYFGAFIGLPPALRAFAQESSALLVPYPLLMSVEVLLRGVLIRQGRTEAIRLAMGCFVLALAAALAAGTLLDLGSGVRVAALATDLAIACEILLLGWQALPVVGAMRQVVSNWA